MKIRLIWDDCTPTRERRPTTSYDIEDDIHLEEFDNLDDLIDTLLDLTDYNIDDLVSEKPMDQIDELIGCLGDIGDGSPNILFLSIDNNIIEDMLEDTDGLTCSEDDVKDEIKQYVEDDVDYDDDLDESLYESNAKPDGDKVSSYNKGLELAKKINKPVVYGYTKGNGKFYEVSPKEYHGDDKAFRSQYSANSIYVAYPDKDFVKEDLKEDYDDVEIDQDLLDTLINDNNDTTTTSVLDEAFNSKKQRCIDMYNSCKDWDDKAITRVSCLCNVNEDTLKEWLNEVK